MRQRPREMAPGETGPTLGERELPLSSVLEGEAGERLRLGLGLSGVRVHVERGDS